MNNKRTRKTIYKWIDIFFLSLPLFLFVGGFIWIIFASKGALSDYTGLSSFVNNFYTDFCWFNEFDSIPGFLGEYVENFVIWFQQSFLFNESTFLHSLFNALVSFFDFIGFDPDVYNMAGSVSYFAFNYFLYIIGYELLSLMIQIVLWIPRYFKNRLENIGGVE